MPTLVEQLKAAERSLKVLGTRGDADDGYDSFVDAVSRNKAEVVRNFLESDNIASQVRYRVNHYSDLAKSVADKYSDFWKKTSAPRSDIEFDLRLQEPIRSMNSVGVAPSIDFLQFMVSRRALDLMGFYEKRLCLDFFIGLVAAVAAGYASVRNAGEISPFIPSAVLVGIPLLGHLSARFFQYSSMSKNISNLETAASTTEKYLQELV